MNDLIFDLYFKTNEKAKKIMKTVDKVFTEEDGVGTIEIVLILVVLIALVYIFKDRLNSLIMQVFSQIDDTAKKIY